MLANGPYPYYLKARVAGKTGHLSNEQAAQALPRLVSPNTQAIVAMHISEKNNQPSLAAKALAQAVGAKFEDAAHTQARTPDGRLGVCVSSQRKPLVIW